MAKRVLITGAAGFFGRYMCEHLASLKQDVAVIGVDIVDCSAENCDYFYNVDLSCPQDATDLVKKASADYVIHLAGILGSDQWEQIYRANVLSMLALLEAVREYAPEAVIVAAGSAAEYGRIERGQLPVDEQTICRPITPYGLSKYLATQVALYYYRAYNICTMVVRPFQLLGKGVTERLAPGTFVAQLKRVVAEGLDIIKAGNLKSCRDFIDVHDAAMAFWALCQKPACGQIFNLCSGRPTKISDLLQIMIDCCRADVKIQVDAERLRGQDDVSVIYGNCQKLKEHCGWQPRKPLEESVSEMFG